MAAHVTQSLTDIRVSVPRDFQVTYVKRRQATNAYTTTASTIPNVCPPITVTSANVIRYTKVCTVNIKRTNAMVYRLVNTDIVLTECVNVIRRYYSARKIQNVLRAN
jgi:hypothetical protein